MLGRLAPLEATRIDSTKLAIGEEGEKAMSSYLAYIIIGGMIAFSGLVYLLSIKWQAKRLNRATIDWGDGTKEILGTGENGQGSVTHIYDKPGGFGVILEVIDRVGKPVTRVQQVRIQPPDLDLEVEVTSNERLEVKADFRWANALEKYTPSRKQTVQAYLVIGAGILVMILTPLLDWLFWKLEFILV